MDKEVSQAIIRIKRMYYTSLTDTLSLNLENNCLASFGRIKHSKTNAKTQNRKEWLQYADI